MELRFYDQNLRRIGIMENMNSMLWHRRYFEPGEFSIICPITDYNVQLCQIGNIITHEGAAEAGTIEEVQLTQQKLITQMSIKGHFLSSQFDRRIIQPQVNFSGTFEDAMRQLVQQFADYPNLVLGERQGYTGNIEFQATYKNLQAYLTKLARGSALGYRVRPDFKEKTLTFEVYAGLDHSVEQRERTRVTFSPEFRNLSTATRTVNDRLYKNVCYVGGRGEGAERVVVVVGDTSQTGLARREIFYSATDIEEEDVGPRPDENDYIDEVVISIPEGGSYTVSHFRESAFNAALAYWESEKARARREYIEALKTRGWQKLDECLVTDVVQCQAIPFGNFEYRVDFDLGDIVTVEKPDWNVKQTARLTEIKEVYEHGAAVIETTLGDPLPEKIDLEGMV